MIMFHLLINKAGYNNYNQTYGMAEDGFISLIQLLVVHNGDFFFNEEERRRKQNIPRVLHSYNSDVSVIKCLLFSKICQFLQFSQQTCFMASVNDC